MSRGTQKLDDFPAENATATFENFREETPEQEALKQQAMRILLAISNPDVPRTITFIAGTPGCGKTHTAAALSKSVQAMGHDTALLVQGGHLSRARYSLRVMSNWLLLMI